MLTRLKVSGFKNLVNVDVRLGPFNCVVGRNGVGKSNFFDAIQFLSSLAKDTLSEAAAAVRDQDSRMPDVRGLFHHAGDRHAERMSFEAEMLVPRRAIDDLGQEARASITFLRYSLTLRHREMGLNASPAALEIEEEKLVHISQRDALRHLLFPHSVKHWRESVLWGRRTNAPFISTHVEGGTRMIYLHQDGGAGGPLARAAASLPRTVLSVANAAGSPTALVARREMEAWRMLRLEPAALRRPDTLSAPARVSTDGSHLPATLYRLLREAGEGNATVPENEVAITQARGRVAEHLAGLVDDVQEVTVDRDENRELLTLYARDDDGTLRPAWALSDGTLRLLALAVLATDPETQGLLCLEEPENGIHPARISAMLQLLRHTAADTQLPVGPDNTLRQVIANTHSPAVLQQVPEDSVLFVSTGEEMDAAGCGSGGARFSCLADTWRTRGDNPPSMVTRDDLLDYLTPGYPEDRPDASPGEEKRRLLDDEDTAQLPLLPVY